MCFVLAYSSYAYNIMVAIKIYQNCQKFIIIKFSYIMLVSSLSLSLRNQQLASCYLVDNLSTPSDTLILRTLCPVSDRLQSLSSAFVPPLVESNTCQALGTI